MIQRKNKKQSETTNHSRESESIPTSSSQKSIGGLSEKQIIHELKCLVAKQEKTIETLMEQIQSLKLQSSNSFNIDTQIRTQDDQQSRKSRNAERQGVEYAELKDCIDEFVKRCLNFHLQRFSLNETQAMSESFPVKSADAKVPRIGKSGSKKKLNQMLMEQSSSEKYKQIIRKVEDLLEKMESKLLKSQAQQRRLQVKCEEQQINIHEILRSYEENISESENIEKKLIQEVERLTIENQQLGGKHSQHTQSFYN